MNQEVELEEEGTDAEFDSGFTGVPTETPEPVETEQPQEEAPPEYHQITKAEYDRLMQSASSTDEMRDTLKKQFDTAFGKIGGLERILKEFQAGTPAGEAVDITEEDFAELREEFPELEAPMLATLKRVAGKMRGTGEKEFDSEKVMESINPALSNVHKSAVETAKVEIANETLDETHEGWRDIIGLPDESGNVPDTEYRKWLTTQPKEYQERLSNSFSPVVIGKSIDKFNEFLKKQNDTTRKSRMADAVTPKGDGGSPSPSDGDDDFEAGFSGG